MSTRSSETFRHKLSDRTGSYGQSRDPVAPNDFSTTRGNAAAASPAAAVAGRGRATYLYVRPSTSPNHFAYGRGRFLVRAPCPVVRPRLPRPRPARQPGGAGRPPAADMPAHRRKSCRLWVHAFARGIYAARAASPVMVKQLIRSLLVVRNRARTYGQGSDMEQQLCRLRQHVAAATTSFSAAGALESVARVYEHAESLAAAARAEQVEDELEASVALLDACAAARDALAAMRACAASMEAAVRRGDGAAADAAARAYARLARKACADVRRQQRRRGGSRLSQEAALGGGGGGHSLQEARRLTVAVLERAMAAVSRRVAAAPGTRRRSASGWSTCVARAFRKSARVACEDAGEATVASLTPLPSKDSRDGEAALRAQRELRALGDTIQRLEDGLELLFRRLVECRVFLLNMHSL
ncbi:hypothetical protein ACP4OV_017692 [Aristida adscensionis]